VDDPLTDFAAIYDEAYYRGEGSDPSVDYAYEEAHPDRTIRGYEWRGFVQTMEHLRPAPAKWLDYGCGTGGLVRHARMHTRYDIFGFDTSTWADRARASGLPVLTEAELAAHEGSFDLVTAVEVIEHCVDPLDVLRGMRRLLKPGGVLFLTTGNALVAPRHFPSWRYASPEIHVSYFTPQSLGLALQQTGFLPFERGVLPGWQDIARSRILKGLGGRNRNMFESLLPWGLLSRLADRHVRINDHPLGRAI